MSSSPATVRPRAAFTLLELVVTLSVIAILATLTMVSLSRSGEIRAVDSGIGMIRDMARAARAQAILAGQPARLIINYDEADPDRFLRYLGIVVRDKEDPANWQAVDRGAYLPQGVYLVPQASAPVDFAANWPDERRSRYKANNLGSVHDTGIVRLEYPLAEPVSGEDAGAPQWIAYQFAPNGSLDAVFESPPPISNALVVGRGDSASGRVAFADPQALKAVLFKRSGSTLPVEELDLL